MGYNEEEFFDPRDRELLERMWDRGADTFGDGHWWMGASPSFQRPSLRPRSSLGFDLDVDNLDDFSMVVDRWDDDNYMLHFVVIRGRQVTGATVHLVLHPAAPVGPPWR